MRCLFVLLLLIAQGPYGIAAEFSDPAANLQRVFALIDERLTIMEQVAAWKGTHGLPVYDAAREQRVLEDTASQAQALGLHAAGIRQLLSLQMEWARNRQQRFIDAWHAHGFDQSVQVQDLNTVLRPRLDRINHALLDALYRTAGDRDSAARRAALADQAAQLAVKFDLGPGSAASIVAAIQGIRLDATPVYDRIRAARTLRVGMTGDYAPFSLERNGHLQGLDVELAQQLSHALGAELVFVKTSWPTLMEDLQSGAFDLAMSGVTITPDREAAALFSVPYQVGGKTAIVRCAEVSRFDSLQKIDAQGVRVIVNPGGTNEQFVREHVHHASIQVHTDNRTVFGEIVAKRADAMLTDDLEVQLQTRLHRELCVAFNQPLTRAAKAILLQRDTALQGKVNEWLTGELERGEVKRQFERAMAEMTVDR